MAKQFSQSYGSTPQSEKADPNQVKNNAGGHSFAISDLSRVNRFLLLGSTDSSYYASGAKIVAESNQAISKALLKHGKTVVDMAIDISENGRAPKNDPAIYVLAVAASCNNIEVRKYALENLSRVCRIGTHLFTFLTYVKDMRGFGRTLREAIAKWYNNMETKRLAMQICKYQSRRVEGGTSWSHLDAIRLSHPIPADDEKNTIFAYLAGKLGDVKPLKGTDMEYIYWHEKLRVSPSDSTIKAALKYGVTRESLPTEVLNRPEVWEWMLEKGMPLTAMIRNLGKMSAIKVLKPLSKNTKIVVDTLNDQKALHQSRIHPLNVLAALETHKNGKGFRGSLTWPVVQQVKGALDSAFYKSFDNVEPTGKNFMVSVDVSGSMNWDSCAGIESLTPRQVAGALAMVIARTEKNSYINAFSHTMVDAKITAKDSLSSVLRKFNNIAAGGTDCALPMIHATKEKLNVDVFVVVTDSETWCGNIHPHEALKKYRLKMHKPNAKLIVIACLDNAFSIADPNDANMLDIHGADTSMPQIISEFVNDRL